MTDIPLVWNYSIRSIGNCLVIVAAFGYLLFLKSGFMSFSLINLCSMISHKVASSVFLNMRISKVIRVIQILTENLIIVCIVCYSKIKFFKILFIYARNYFHILFQTYSAPNPK